MVRLAGFEPTTLAFGGQYKLIKIIGLQSFGGMLAGLAVFSRF
jgi:hypothetical protein